MSHMSRNLSRAIVGIIFGAIAPRAFAIAIVDCSETIVVNAQTGGNSSYGEGQHEFHTSSTTQPCFRLEDGYDLDLNGNTITCDGAAPCAAAVVGTAPGSVLEGGTIDGDFATCVANVFEVVGVTFRGCRTAIFGEAGLTKKIWKNVLRGEGGAVGIDADINMSLGFIKSNLISGYATAIRFSGTSTGTGPMVSRNVIADFDTGVESLDQTRGRIESNLFCQANLGADALSYGASKALSSNSCCNDEETACQTVAPFENQ